MAVNFDKFDKAFDVEMLKHDVEEARTNGGGDFKEVPIGDYEVQITKLELSVSKKGDPMFVCWMKIVNGEYANSLLFMNQVVTQGFQIHIANEFLRSLVDGMEIYSRVEFESYSKYAELILDIAEAIDGEREYLVEYGEKKGFNTFKIKEVYELSE